MLAEPDEIGAIWPKAAQGARPVEIVALGKLTRPGTPGAGWIVDLGDDALLLVSTSQLQSFRHFARAALEQADIELAPMRIDEAGLERDAAVARAVGHPRGAAQQSLHLACPVFLLDIDQGLEFAQVMGIAESMEHARHRIIGLPVVMHDRADDIRQQAATSGADAIEGQRGS